MRAKRSWQLCNIFKHPCMHIRFCPAQFDAKKMTLATLFVAAIIIIKKVYLMFLSLLRRKRPRILIANTCNRREGKKGKKGIVHGSINKTKDFFFFKHLTHP